MPHFVIDCTENVLTLKLPEEILKAVHDSADSTGLFSKGDIKVRIRSFKHSIVGNTNEDFVHVFGHIMDGRSIKQKANLSQKIIKKLKSMLPTVHVVSINIQEFEKSTYCNRNMI